MVFTSLALINRAADWSGLEPRFVESAADSLAEATGLPHGDCAGLVIVAAVFVLFQVGRAVYGVLAAPGSR